jgi:hypothetical protein
MGVAYMEYPSKNDIFLKFKALYDGKNNFLDYILVESSENFHNVINYKSNPYLGRKISEIALEEENDILNLKNLYYHMIPKTRRKFEMYIEELETWYLVNMFSDERDYLLIFYTDISRYKNGEKMPMIKSFDIYSKKDKFFIS